MPKEPQSLAVYFHWPFCVSKCPYCDFNSHVRESIDTIAWRDALLRELKFMGELTPNRRIKSIFFGGGTPSLMPASLVESLIAETCAQWSPEDSLEVTLEANPSSVESEKFSDFRAAGVNRVSLGVQSLKESSLKFLGRRHSAQEALRALQIAQKFFPRFSFDLIYALPHQTPTLWREELTQALQEAGDHLSLYQLTIEEGTGFFSSVKQGKFQIPDEDLAGSLYETTQEIMEAAGFPAYEISNHAKPGFECRHNLAYWRYEDYVGIGPGAHGRLTQEGTTYATHCIRSPEAWMKAVAEKGNGMREKTPLSRLDKGWEACMMGFRLREGIHKDFFEERVGEPLLSFLNEKVLSFYEEQKYLEWAGPFLRATPYGQQRLNTLLAGLLKMTL